MGVIANRGFTMIELMVTISIAAILVSMAAPSFQSLIVQSRLTTQANQLITSLHYARSEAVKRGGRVTVCTSDNGATCVAGSSWQDGWIIFSDRGATGTLDAGSDQLLRVFDGLKGSTLGGGNNFGNWITYQANGRSQGNGGLANGTFGLCSNAHGRNISINITGRIAVQDVSSC
jgi:type IV fimbrial biogenesis protein FimT